ncbi:MAG TPA: conjugal transfer protein [Candidatus Blautia stercoripullorum]|uniref:Conjugal transfer protein n=1 Tax=Candidatus Blautia stercoripullorum TaxID=2838502 RepID=A0A9D2RBC1_9FIRM|nr:conjugal transfer protein [Candidatus Blautia stercoripullorum]
MFRKNKEKRVRTMKVGTHRKSVIALWLLLIGSVSFGIYKNFTAIDQHTTHEKEIIQLQLNDTSGIENFVKDFARAFYEWENNEESIQARTAAISNYLTPELQDLNMDTVRTDIPTCSYVNDVQIWDIKEAGDQEYQIKYSVEQYVTKGEEATTVESFFETTVHVDSTGNMVIVQSPVPASRPEKSDYEPKAPESDGSVDAKTIQEATDFLETFFKLYPTATEEELAYYVEDYALEPIEEDYIFSELINPIFKKEEENIKVHVNVAFIDQNTKATIISGYDLTIKKEENWLLISS